MRGGDEDLAREAVRTFEHRTEGQRGYFRLAYMRSTAVLARWYGDTEKATSILYEVLGEAGRLGLPGDLWQVASVLGEVHEECGETGPAERAFGRASNVIHDLAAKISDFSLRKAFLAAPRVREVRGKARSQGTDDHS